MVLDLNPTLANGQYSHLVSYDGLTIQETAGREGSDNAGSSTASRTWLVRGSSNPIACRTALFSASEDVTLTGFDINEYDGLFISDLSRELFAPDAWEFTATYNQRQPKAGGYTISIDTTGGQIVQTYSYAQAAFPATGLTAPSLNGAIDVQDGAPQGVERIIPALKLNIRAKIAAEYVTSPIAYSKLLSDLTGTINQQPMFDDEFAAGELLFAGASGDVVGAEPTLTYTFLASQNVAGLTIGNITGINKKGHEYIWFLFADDRDSVTGLPVKKPRAAYVDRIYGEADHGLMRIGVAPTS